LLTQENLTFPEERKESPPNRWALKMYAKVAISLFFEQIGWIG
jgi:hypothetical protein